MKKLIICLSSYSPSKNSLKEKYDRQELYAIALWNLTRGVSNDTDICVVENTTSEEKIENEKLKNILQNSNIKYKIFIEKNDLGSKNKGAGELEMCQAVLNSLKEKLNQYEYVIYYTSRHIIYGLKDIEEKIDNNHYDILIGNPNFILSNGKMLTVAPGNFNDMLFAMKSALFTEYCSNINLEELIAKKMNSERYLYIFTTEKTKQRANIYSLNEIPLIRYDYAVQEMHLVSNNMQSYKHFDTVLKIYIDFYKNFPQKIDNAYSQINEKVIITDSILKKKLSLLLGKLAMTTNEYKYNIEPTWAKLSKKIVKNKKGINLPVDIETSFIYQNRISNLN